MIVTEEEAKTKRCQESFPAADALSPEGSATVVPMPVQAISSMGPMGFASTTMGYARHTAPTHCIGSACMAWRWKRGSVYVPDPLDETHFTQIEDKGDYSTTHGFCGKAGKP